MDPIPTDLLLLIDKAAALVAILWQGLRALLRQAAVKPPQWLNVFGPRVLTLALFLVYALGAGVARPVTELVIGSLVALFAANFIYDLTKAIQPKAG